MPRLDLGKGQSIFFTDEGDGAPVIALHGYFLHQEAPDRFAAATRAWLDRMPIR